MQLSRLVELSRERAPVIVVGAPLRWQGHLYNCAVAIHRGRVLGVVPKIYLPNYREFYERRHFTSGEAVWGAMMAVAGQEAPFGIDLLFAATGPVGFTFHIEICEDLWVPQPPSAAGAAAGAEVLLNLSASNITVGNLTVASGSPLSSTRKSVENVSRPAGARITWQKLPKLS